MPPIEQNSHSERSLRIIQVCSGTDQLRRGAERFCLALSNSLVSSGHQLTLLTGNRVPEHLNNLPFPSLSIPESTDRITRKIGLDYVNPFAIQKFKRHFDKIRPQIIHFHSIYGLSTASVAIAAKHCPVVVTIHDGWLAFLDSGIVSPRFDLANSYYKVPLGFFHRRINRYFLRKAMLVSPSHWMKTYFHTAGFQCPIQISNGIQPAGPITSYQNTLIWVGALTHFKGLPSVIADVSLFMVDIGWRFVVIGDGPCRSELENNYPDVEFIGYQNPEPYYQTASLLIVSSIGLENFPTVILEAMQHGLCVIGRGTGGTSELIQHMQNGVLYDSNQSLIDTLRELTADTSKIRRLGKSAERTFDENYAWDTCLNKYIKLYHSLVD